MGGGQVASWGTGCSGWCRRGSFRLDLWAAKPVLQAAGVEVGGILIL